MYKTIMATPMLAVQGKYALLTQQDTDDKAKKRYVIIDSVTLKTRGTYEGENAKKAFEDEIELILSEGTQKKGSPLEQMLSADEATDETEVDSTEG